jgi:glycosyltransferase involved in cell wall biosynthesis
MPRAVRLDRVAAATLNVQVHAAGFRRGRDRCNADYSRMFTDPVPARKAEVAAAVAICVPTFRRNQLLAGCLSALRALRVPHGFRLLLIVADNDEGGGARETCAELGAALPWPVHYVIEPRRGLASVRNRLLDEAARAGAGWIAFIDDDERAEPDWLERHMQSLERSGAVVSSGPVVQPETPGSGARPDRPSRRDGDTPRHVACNNVVFSMRLVTEQGLRFDPRFDFMGGEDFDFFDASKRLGNAHVWTARAVVCETVPPERATVRYLFTRHYSGAINSVVRYRKQRGAPRAWLHFGLKSLGKLLGACAALLCWPLRGRIALRDFVKRVANTAGYVSGLANVRSERYR